MFSQPEPWVRICATVRLGFRKIENSQQRDRQHEQRAERRAREQILQPAPDEHADVEQLFLPDRGRDRRRDRQHRDERERIEIWNVAIAIQPESRYAYTSER